MVSKLSLSVVVVALVALAAICAQQVDATLFILGEACVFGLRGVNAFASGPLEELGVEEALETVINFCQAVADNSIGGVISAGVEASLRDLVRLARSGTIAFRLPELAERIQDLAGQINATVDFQVSSGAA